MAEMNAEWRNWVEENVLRGVAEKDLMQILLQNEFDEFLAYETVVETANRHQGQSVLAALSMGEVLTQCKGFQVPAPCSGQEKPWSVAMKVSKPNIVLYHNVLTHEECDRLIALGMPKLKQSTTIDNETGEAVPHEHRTSQGAFFQLREDEFIQSLDERTAAIMNMPVGNGEGIQILNYQVGGEYKPHYDYFPPNLAGSTKHINMGGQRVSTLILYLNHVAEGGETVFPEVNLKVSPLKGSAVYFSYFQDSKVDPMTLHGGMPVIAGEKWIATKWMRENTFQC